MYVFSIWIPENACRLDIVDMSMFFTKPITTAQIEMKHIAIIFVIHKQ